MQKQRKKDNFYNYKKLYNQVINNFCLTNISMKKIVRTLFHTRECLVALRYIQNEF